MLLKNLTAYIWDFHKYLLLNNYLMNIFQNYNENVKIVDNYIHLIIKDFYLRLLSLYR